MADDELQAGSGEVRVSAIVSAEFVI